MQKAEEENFSWIKTCHQKVLSASSVSLIKFPILFSNPTGGSGRIHPQAFASLNFHSAKTFSKQALFGQAKRSGECQPTTAQKIWVEI